MIDVRIAAVLFKRYKDSNWEKGLYVEHDVYQILDSGANVVGELYDIKHNEIELSLNLDYIFKNEYEGM